MKRWAATSTLKFTLGAIVISFSAAASAVAAGSACVNSTGNIGFQRRIVVGNSAHYTQPGLIISSPSEKAFFRANDLVSVEGFCYLQGYKKGVLSQTLPLHPSFSVMMVSIDLKGELLDLSLSRANLDGALIAAITCREPR